MGKSALLAAWLARREVAGAVVPHHFIRRGEYDWDDPAKLVGSLVAQIEARFPEQREPEADARMHPAARLDATLRRVSENELTPRGERLVVLIDGLDEYDPPAGTLGRDPLAAFLPRALPRGVSLVCASRPRHPYVDMLATRGAVQLDLDDERAFAADNEATVRAFWEQAAPELGLDARFIAEAVARAGGNLQHAAMLRQHLAGLPPEQRRVEDIPRGLAALLASAWERIATDPVVVDGLGILCAAREALTLDELGAVAGWTSEAQRRAFLRGARELLIESRREGAVPEYRLHHDSIRRQIAEAIGGAALRGHHRALAHGLATWPGPKEATARRYALRHALAHRAEAGEWADAWRLAADMGFVEAKCRELGAHDAEADLARVAERCRASGDETLYGRFGDLARALGRESHWLRDAPEATAALLWNRLRQSGWSADDIDHQLQVPADAIFLRMRHLATRESPALVRDLVGHAWTVNACAVTPDGRRVVSASNDDTLKVWDLESGCIVANLEGHTLTVNACAVTPDGRQVVSASDDYTLKVWDLASGRRLANLEGHTARVRTCAVTRDGQHVVSASDDNTLKVWDLASGHPLATLEGHADWVRACAVTPDGRRVVSASDDTTLKIWDLASGHPLATLEGHASSVRACAVTPDGRYVVSASDDATLKIWDLASGHPLATLEGHTAEVLACAVTPDGRLVVSASYDRTLKVWDLASGQLLTTLQGHAAAVNECALTPDSSLVVSASEDNTLKVWNLAPGQPIATVEGHADWVRACAVTPDGRLVVSASEDKTLKVWDPASGRALLTLRDHTARVLACTVTPDGQRVISTSDDNTLKVWDLASGYPLATLEGSARGLTCAVTPDGSRVISVSDDNTINVWDLASRQPLAALGGYDYWVSACAVSRDGRLVISASSDNTIKVWNIESRGLVRLDPLGASRRTSIDFVDGLPLATLQGHADKVLGCVVTPDGRRVVSASLDHTLKIWDLKWGLPLLATLQGHANWVLSCAVTPDGRHLVSASLDNTLKVWDIESYTCLLTHRANTGFTAVAATATAIIAGDAAGSVWFLDWPPSSAP
jgi:WD40 repeat protein